MHRLQTLPGRSGRHPTSAALRGVATILGRAKQVAEDNSRMLYEHDVRCGFSEPDLENYKPGVFLKMSEGGISTTRCGTTACFAGWFAATYHCPDSDPHNPFIGAREGIDQIGKFLGFGPSNVDSGWVGKLSLWAFNNSDLWGNCHGGGVFPL